MTAFAGVLYPSSLETSDITNLMLEPLSSRSSGEKTILTFKNYQIGCLGNSCATSSKKELHLLLDGTIYNAKQLAETHELSPSLSQAELLLALYEKLGNNFLKDLNGEFAIVILNQKNHTLILAKDLIGKKPLYWYQDKKYFLFCSEIKGLLSSGLIPQTPSTEALATYLFFGFFPQDLTPVRDINKLLPSHYLELSPHGIHIQPYWSYSSFFERRLNLHKSQIVATINSMLHESVAERIPPRGPLSCFVSGGLGSATTAYYVSQHAKKHSLKAFTAVFENYNEEDLNAADSVCESLDLPHDSSLITPELFLREFPKILWHLDEPIADPNVIATWELAKISSHFSHFAYSGMGSDELLAGHSRYSMAERSPAALNRLLLIPRPILQGIMIPALKVLYPSAAFNLLRSLKTNPWQFEFLRHNAVFNENMLEEASPRLSHAFDPDTFLHKFHHLTRIHSNISSLLYFDIKTRLPDCFIHQYERMTRAFNINWETPFLDKNLLEFTAQLAEPESLTEKETASYLKPLVRDLFPEAFINRPKKTRHHFLAGWIDHPEVKEVFQLLPKGTLVESGLISDTWLKSTLSSSASMKNSYQQLFTILTLELWFKLFINKMPGNTAPEVTIKELLLEK